MQVVAASSQNVILSNSAATDELFLVVETFYFVRSNLQMFIKFYFLALLHGVFGDSRPKITVTFGNGTTIIIDHSAFLNVSEDVVGPVKLICTAEHSITWKTKALSENMGDPNKLILEPSLLNDAIEPRYTQATAIKSFGKLTKFHSALYICQPEGEGSFYNTAYLNWSLQDKIMMTFKLNYNTPNQIIPCLK
ncbi:hypothetical protein Ocin01_16092 [Orchesella cincta]|uniref:Uncharacterized protein n=1 Tax=Orchesella cincta TaxID=48709 RepID=A0A1D2MC91_ORCCI|nr:hypothetical protein Ocin01_16092 [Orchesella cincta]